MNAKAFQLAITRAKALPEAAQERLGRAVLSGIEKLETLRADLHVGIDQLDRGEGRPIDVYEIIGQARRQHGRSS